MPCKVSSQHLNDFQDCIAQLHEIVSTYKQTHQIIIGGDFNEDIVNGPTSQRKTYAKDFMKELDFETKYTGSTFIHSNGCDTTAIDYFIFQDLYKHTVLEISKLDIESNVSDHYPIKLILQYNHPVKQIKSSNSSVKPKIKWDKVDTQLYESLITSEISDSKPTIKTIEDVTKAFKNLNEIIVKSTKAAAPAIKIGEKRPKLQVMNDAIKEAIKKKKLAFHDWKINGRPKESDSIYLKKKKLTTHILRIESRLEVAKRRINERQKVINTRTSDRNMFYRVIKNQRGKLSRFIDQLNVDDNTYHNENIIEGWRSHFHNLAKKEPNQNYDTQYLELIEKEAKIIIDIYKDRFKHNPITEEEISKAISSCISDILKIGTLFPVFKNKGDARYAKNYRGITVTPIYSKIIEKIIKLRENPIILERQNPLQRGLTENTTPLLCELIIKEFERESKDLKLPTYIALLDGKSAFDVVRNKTSEVFEIEQGVRQGGAISADLYKLYVNPLLNLLCDTGIGGHIGNIGCCAPTCADDVAIIANNPIELQTLVNIAVNFRKREGHTLQPTKSVILPVNTSSRAIEIEDNFWHINNNPLPVVEHSSHIGIQKCQKKSAKLTVDENVKKARRSLNSLMGAGLHGRNGLDPETVITLLNTYVMPILTYGLEILLPKGSNFDTIHQFHKKIIKQILSLSQQIADPAIYILSGMLSIEAEIHLKALTLFGNITRANKTSVECRLAERQLQLKSHSSKSWFIEIKKICLKYNLPDCQKFLINPLGKFQWKNLITRKIYTYWSEKINDKSEGYSSLQHITGAYKIKTIHPILTTNTSNCRDFIRIPIRTKVATGNYILQSNRAKFNKYEVSATCKICNKEDETIEHFLIACTQLEPERKSSKSDTRLHQRPGTSRVKSTKQRPTPRPRTSKQQKLPVVQATKEESVDDTESTISEDSDVGFVLTVESESSLAEDSNANTDNIEETELTGSASEVADSISSEVTTIDDDDVPQDADESPPVELIHSGRERRPPAWFRSGQFETSMAAVGPTSIPEWRQKVEYISPLAQTPLFKSTGLERDAARTILDIVNHY
ncbi:unnamed protein product [Mytilus coruscus]|uniref:Reverse transcriptase domain-containing protein n=1 Tax=Mytilus coruscus TaxID=42192 RepID=A0A6J8DA95_MYTCO|nr:unnamed protein product [Mytilus coruscus]